MGSERGVGVSSGVCTVVDGLDDGFEDGGIGVVGRDGRGDGEGTSTCTA